jgi:hypothetical protein
MSEDIQQNSSTLSTQVEDQALAALHHLSDEDKHKVLEYIASLIHLEQVTNDNAKST